LLGGEEGLGGLRPRALAGCAGLPAISARTSRGSTRVGSIPIVCVEDGAPSRCDATPHLGEQNRASARLG
jgi:hypothetical protein